MVLFSALAGLDGNGTFSEVALMVLFLPWQVWTAMALFSAWAGLGSSGTFSEVPLMAPFCLGRITGLVQPGAFGWPLAGLNQVWCHRRATGKSRFGPKTVTFIEVRAKMPKCA